MFNNCSYVNLDDPVHEHLGDDEQHSVLKFLADIYSSISTSAMFYTNDAKVLVDILIRQLSDLPAGTSVKLILTVHQIFIDV